MPQVVALKMAESLGLLKSKGAYGISRLGYYEQMQQRRPEQFVDIRRRFGKATRVQN